MPPRRFLLSTFGTLGDIIPYARLAGELLGRGHHVTVHSWAQFATWFPAGAQFTPAAAGVEADELDRTMGSALEATSHDEQMRRFARYFYGLGEGTSRAQHYLDHARAAFAQHDLAVINTLDHVGQRAAEMIGLPWVSYASRPPPDPRQADPMFAQVDAELGELLAAVTGEHRHVRLFREASPLCAVAACSAELVPPALHGSALLSGPWLAPASAATPLPIALDEYLAKGPALFVTFGTMPEVNDRTSVLIAAIVKSGWRAILQVLPPVAVPSGVPDSILVLRDRVAFDSLLPRVAGVIHHGSVGTAHEIVRAGKPSFVVPHMGDQFFWALALHERGLGPAPVRSHEIEPDVVAGRLIALGDPGYAARAAALAPVIAAQDGVPVTADRLEQLVR